MDKRFSSQWLTEGHPPQTGTTFAPIELNEYANPDNNQKREAIFLPTNVFYCVIQGLDERNSEWPGRTEEKLSWIMKWEEERGQSLIQRALLHR